MAQYWLEVSSEADLAHFQVLTSGTLSYTTDSGTPVIVFSSTTAVGEYVKFTDVGEISNITACTVAVLFKVTVGGTGVYAGPSLGINGSDGFNYGKTTSTTYRPSKTSSGAWTQLSSNLSSQPAGSTWGWLEISYPGAAAPAQAATFECRNWQHGANRPGTANRTFSEIIIPTSVSAGFGAPSNIGSGTSYIRVIAVGTDGDPAPTGPVAPAERQRSRLILTPW